MISQVFSMFASADHAVAHGCVLALALVVLTHYVLHVCRAEVTRHERDRGEAELDVLSSQLDASKRDYSLIRLENHALHEFLAQTQVDRMVDLLLRRFVPRTDRGFAALIERDGRGTVCRFSRGLSEESLASLRVSDGEFSVVQQAQAVALAGRDVADSSVVAGLTRIDAAKAKRLHLIAVGDGEACVGLLAATDLHPTAAPPAQQVELARRLLGSLAGHVRRDRLLKERESQLRLTNEMLDLRAVVDRRYDEPTAMIAAFLTALQKKLSAEGAAMFLTQRDGRPAPLPAARTGGPNVPGQSARWRRAEESLAVLGAGAARPRALSAAELVRADVDGPMRSALLIPVRRSDAAVGLICLAWSAVRQVTPDDLALADWAGDFLAHALPRAMNQAAIERQARLDGLTGLANRREFDVRFDAALAAARRDGSEVSLILCDLDRFKSVNDTYGHPAGDEVLRTAARVLQEESLRMRSGDSALFARYGGEELAVLLPSFGQAGVLRIAENLRAAIELAPAVHDGRTIRVTASFGTATFPDDGDSGLIARADAALYAAKSGGRNRVVAAGAVPVAATV